MNNAAKNLGILAIGLIVVIITGVIFFAGFSQDEKTSLDYVALLFELLAEAAFFGGLVFVLHNDSMGKVFIRAGIISTMVLYWLATSGINLLSKRIFADNLGGFVTVQLVLMGITAIIVICLLMAASGIHASDQRMEKARLWLQEAENMAFTLKTDTRFASYSDSLDKLYEALRFSDKTAADNTRDMEIATKIEELTNDLRKGEIEEKEINTKISEVILQIKERNSLVLQSKRGGF